MIGPCAIASCNSASKSLSSSITFLNGCLYLDKKKEGVNPLLSQMISQLVLPHHQVDSYTRVLKETHLVFYKE